MDLVEPTRGNVVHRPGHVFDASAGDDVGVGAQHVVIRKIDGAEILRRVRDHGVTVMCAAPAVAAAVANAGAAR